MNCKRKCKRYKRYKAIQAIQAIQAISDLFHFAWESHPYQLRSASLLYGYGQVSYWVLSSYYYTFAPVSIAFAHWNSQCLQMTAQWAPDSAFRQGSHNLSSCLCFRRTQWLQLFYFSDKRASVKTRQRTLMHQAIANENANDLPTRGNELQKKKWWNDTIPGTHIPGTCPTMVNAKYDSERWCPKR